MGCGADTEANELMTSLLAGKDFTLPAVDLSGADFQLPEGTAITPPTKLTNDDLTSGTSEGEGTLDRLLKTVNAHLQVQFEKNRITGAEFTKAYIAMFQAALSTSVQFLLGKDQAYWAAVAAQMQAEIARTQLVTSRVELEIAKVTLKAKFFEALSIEATYALAKMKLSTESIAYCTAKFSFDHILPIQEKMLLEQWEAARAQTLDVRSDGTPVVGMLGKQKDLYTQQIISYQRDAEVKTAKLFTDAWITMKTMDEGLLPPTSFDNDHLNKILNTLITNNSFTG